MDCFYQIDRYGRSLLTREIPQQMIKSGGDSSPIRQFRRLLRFLASHFFRPVVFTDTRKSPQLLWNIRTENISRRMTALDRKGLSRDLRAGLRTRNGPGRAGAGHESLVMLVIPNGRVTLRVDVKEKR